MRQGGQVSAKGPGRDIRLIKQQTECLPHKTHLAAGWHPGQDDNSG
jgi:hypothetical protein